MVVHWHSATSKHEPFAYQKEGEDSWHFDVDKVTSLGKTKTFIHSVSLSHLEPDARYFFQFEQKGPRYYFRTLPGDLRERPIRFVVGGDLFYNYKNFTEMNRQIAQVEADFLVLGGDLAYAQSPKTFFKNPRAILKRWSHFFKLMKEATIKADGRVVPIVPIIGNHDLSQSEKEKKERSFFASFFPEMEMSYRFLDLSSLATLLLLDTGHLEPIAGRQTRWLDETLKLHEEFKYKIPIYHVAAYPSYYSYENNWAEKIRKNWVPLFEKHQVKVAFEHHNHGYKKTVPLKEGQLDSSGIVYLGDGSWGVPQREIHKRWYLEDVRQINHYWLVTLDQEGCLVQSFDHRGNLIDSLPVP